MSFENLPNFFLNSSENGLNTDESHFYRFKSFTLDVSERRLYDNGVTIPLTPKAFDVLAYLVQNEGHLIEKDELMNAVWPDSFVDEVNLPRTIHIIRKTLGEDEGANKFIETVPTKGYRFVAEVSEGDKSDVADPTISETPSQSAAFVDTSISPDGNDRMERRIWSKFLVAGSVLILVVVATAFWTARNGMLPGSSSKGQKAETNSGEAHQNYTQGRFFVERRHKGDQERALEYFEKAIELDPTYSAAYAAKADAKVILFWASSTHDDISEARTAVRKAIELDDSNSYAHTVLCRILTTYDWDHKEAEKECLKAVELNPDDHEAQKEFAFLLHSLGKESEALLAIDRAIAIAPTSFNKTARGIILYQSRRYQEAVEQLKQVEETDTNFREASRWLMRSYAMNKDFALALESYLKLTKHGGATESELAAIRSAFEQNGWEGILRKIIESSDQPNMMRVGAHSQLGDKDRAFEMLDQMMKRRAILLVTIQREPTLDPIRSDPRFAQILKTMNFK